MSYNSYCLCFEKCENLYKRFITQLHKIEVNVDFDKIYIKKYIFMLKKVFCI